MVPQHGAGQMRPSQARPYWAEPLLARLVAVMPQSHDGKRKDKNAERLTRSTPEAAYSVSQVVGSERPLPHSRSEGAALHVQLHAYNLHVFVPHSSACERMHVVRMSVYLPLCLPSCLAS